MSHSAKNLALGVFLLLLGMFGSWQHVELSGLLVFFGLFLIWSTT